jgi:putative copper export protein
MTLHWILLSLHLLGASVWTGGHLILAIRYLPQALRTNSITELQSFEDRFERVGIPALLIQILSGFWLGFQLIPEFHAWFDLTQPLSRTLLMKLSLLLLTLLLAIDARLRIIPRLTPQNLRGLAWHILPVTVISVLLVLIGTRIRFGGF